ncbi:hypothetical protein LCGC14_0355940 [marine sediment metagenome]|uniref:Uncharacterized protein n=1 Tax=marine sediment metagenome TaxID=412755 RepID=A0A0F9TSD2_9ZZZZ
MKAIIHYLLLECKKYRNEIYPLRNKVDNDEGTCSYDEAYTEWLESVHATIEQHFEDAGLLEEIE